VGQLDDAPPPLLLHNVKAALDAMPKARALDVAKLQETIKVLTKISHLADGIGGNAAQTDKITNAVKELQAAGIDIADATSLATTVNKVLDHVGSDGNNSPSQGDLAALGVSGLNGDIISAVQTRLQKAGRTNLNTLPKLQELVNSVITAQAKIRDYAANSSADVPTSADYAAIAVTLPTTPAAVATAIVGAVNQALASTPVGSAEANTPRKVQDIINSYAKLLTMANGSSDTASDNLPAVTDYTNVGLDTTLAGKVQVWKQNITADNYRSFVRSVGATVDGRSTTLVVDLDGAGAQQQTYTLTLQNLRFDAANTHTIFGV